MPASRSKRKRSEIDQGKVPSATARRGSSKSSSGNELKRAKNEAKKETDPVVVIDAPTQSAEHPFKATVSQDKTEQSELVQRAESMTGAIESSENIPPPAQPQSCAIDSTSNDNNSLLVRQGPEIQSTNVNSETKDEITDYNAAHSRKSRIIAAITHRTLLLKRIRQCESAAIGRISSVIQFEREEIDIVSRKSASNAADGSGAAQITSMAADEVEYFRELSRLASQAAKRQRSEGGEGTADPRPSVSLRRGASVGKRMNAALSTLAPGGNAVLPSIEPLTATAGISSNSQVPLTSTLIVPKTLPSQNLPTLVQSQPSTVQSLEQQPQPQQLQQHLLQPASIAIGKTVQSQPKEKSKRSGMKQPKLTQSTTLSDQYAPSAQPLHQRAGGSTLPPNRLAQSKVVCQQTNDLREKRGALRLKLAALLFSKESGQNRHDSQQKQFQTFSFESQKSSQEEPRSWDTAGKDVVGPLRLPKRRKSHWDYVLEEMRWTATDFIEERKWKLSSARLLASAVMSGTGSNSTGVLSAPQAAPAPSQLTNVEIVETPIECQARADGVGEPCSKANGRRQADSSDLLSEIGNQRPRLRHYESPSTVELTTSQQVARLVSSLPKLLSTALHESGAQPVTDSCLVDALQSGQNIRQNDIFEQGSGNTEQKAGINENGLSKQSFSTRMSITNSEATLIEPVGKDTYDSMDSSPLISRDQQAKYVEDLRSKVEAFVSAPPRRSKQPRLHEPLALSSEQEEAIRFAEYVWSEIDSAGVVVGGPAFSGKTTVSCLLLWRHRDSGPQLLICSPSSVIRWEFELSRFSGLRVMTLGFNEGISHHLPAVDSDPKFMRGDVIVCEYSFLMDSKMPGLSSFTGIAIDSRYPLGFFGSVGSTDLLRDRDLPFDSISAVWWETLLGKLPSRGTRRLLVDCAVSQVLQTTKPQPSQTRTDLEEVAHRVAFVLGPRTCGGVSSSRARNVITWAKYAARAFSDVGDDKAERVRAVLSRSLLSFSYYFESSPMSDTKVRTSWEQRQCVLPKSQRLAYNVTCSEVRGILSKSLDDNRTSFDGSDHYEETVNSLLRLRRVCSHANMERILSDSVLDARYFGSSPRKHHGLKGDGTSTFQRRIRESASQPDLERAFRILLGSGKIRELACILRSECGCQLAGDDILTALIPINGPRKSTTQQKSKNSKPAKRRIVILAELPDLQMLVSMFLSAVGLQHDLLLHSGASSPLNAGSRQGNEERVALAWIEHQLCLLKFNSGDLGVKASASCAIVVGSPSSVGADHCGLGIQCADLVISMDEDWSGRCHLVMRALVAQSLAWNRTYQRAGCTFIRLVSSGTCEELFLTALKCLDGELRPFLLTTDNFGIVTDIQPSRGDSVSNLLWDFRGQELSKILCYKGEFPTNLGPQSPRRFLPQGANEYRDDKTEKERMLLRQLLQKAHLLAGGQLSFSSNDKEMRSTTQSENLSSFLLVFPPSRCPQYSATRNDRWMLASRLFLERSEKLASWKQITADSTSASVPSLDVSNWDRFVIDSGSALDGSELIESWHKNIFSGRPADSAASVLLYSSTVSDDATMQPAVTSSKLKFSSMEAKRSERVSSLNVASSDPRQLMLPRLNSFAGSYSIATIDNTMRDGNQGCEAAVYFPPIFPSLVLFNSQANFDSKRQLPMASDESKPPFTSFVPQNDLKRSLSGSNLFATAPNSKRLKAQNVFSGTWDIAGGADMLPPAFSSPTSHLSHTPRKAVTAVSGRREQPSMPERFGQEALEHAEIEYIRILNEDFGLAGTGLLPPVFDSATAARMMIVECANSALDCENSGDYEASLSGIPCDAEESEKTGFSNSNSSQLNTMILFVVKPKPRMSIGAVGQSFRTNQGLVGELSWTAMPNNLPPIAYTGGSNGTMSDVNGGAKKTTKKKSPGPLPPLGPSAFSRIPAPDISDKMRPPATPASISAPSKDGNRNRMMLSPEVAQLLGKLFDIPSFRLASVRVRNRISDRASRLDRGSNDRGHGLPMLDPLYQHLSTKLDPSSWISLARKLRNPKSQTGDEARNLSIQQKAALRKSLVSPVRVDFGPFQSGFLVAAAGMTGIPPPRSRIGVSLPMGVKVPQALREHNVPPWSGAEDRKLQLCAVRFGLNWVLASRSLTGLEDVLVSSRRRSLSNETPSFPRSARHCRDRWQLLVKSQPSLAKDVRKSERMMRERAVMAAKDIPQFSQRVMRMQAHDEDPTTSVRRNVAILVSASALDEQGEDSSPAMIIDTEVSEPHDDTQLQQQEGCADLSEETRPRRSFAACKAARSKQVVIPLAMPGLTSGTGAAVVASHQSHMQAVQAALATANSSSSRNELWPLQILELADKHRAAAARALAEATSSSAIVARPSSSHSHKSATTSTTQSGTNGRGMPFPQVPLPPPRSSSTKGVALLQPERLGVPSTGSPSRSPRKTSIALPAQALPPPPMAHTPPPPPPPPAQPQQPPPASAPAQPQQPPPALQPQSQPVLPPPQEQHPPRPPPASNPPTAPNPPPSSVEES